MRLTDFFLGMVCGIGAALLFTRCPRPPLAGERPSAEAADGNGKVYEWRKAVS